MQSIAQDQPLIAYFSMEIGLHPAMPTYSGGLGIVAGDTLSPAAFSDVTLRVNEVLGRGTKPFRQM